VSLLMPGIYIMLSLEAMVRSHIHVVSYHEQISAMPEAPKGKSHEERDKFQHQQLARFTIRDDSQLIATGSHG
jgi:hypothetical protein